MKLIELISDREQQRRRRARVRIFTPERVRDMTQYVKSDSIYCNHAGKIISPYPYSGETSGVMLIPVEDNIIAICVTVYASRPTLGEIARTASYMLQDHLNQDEWSLLDRLLTTAYYGRHWNQPPKPEQAKAEKEIINFFKKMLEV